MVGRNSSVSSNPACVGRYSFAQFKSSAVCYTNPLHTGRYLGIIATDKHGLSLSKVEVYSRGNVMYNMHGVAGFLAKTLFKKAYFIRRASSDF